MKHEECKEKVEALLEETIYITVYTVQQLIDIISPKSREQLVLVLGELVAEGRMSLKFRVGSPKEGYRIQDYDSLEDIPEEVNDCWQAKRVKVVSEMVKPIYVFEEGMSWKDLGKPFEKEEDIPRKHLMYALRLAGKIINCSMCGKVCLKHLEGSTVCSTCALLYTSLSNPQPGHTQCNNLVE